MKYLALNTALSFIEVAAVDGSASVYLSDSQQRKASEAMLTLTDKALTLAGIGLGDVDFVACCIGPGSFTGIRIGVSTARAFAHSLNKKIVLFTSHDVLAYNVMCDGTVVCVSDAGNGFVYISVYGDGAVSSEPVCMLKAEAVDFAGSLRDIQALVCEQSVSQLFDGAVSVTPTIASPSEAALTGAVKNAFTRRGAVDYEAVVPLYIRQPQAVTDLKNK